MEFPGKKVQKPGVPAGPAPLGVHHLLTHKAANLRWYAQSNNYWNSLGKSKSLVFLLYLHLCVPSIFSPTRKLT